MSGAAAYPALRRLLGTMQADWRTAGESALDYLAGRADELSRTGELDRAALAADFDVLFRDAAAEFDHVQVVNTSGAQYTPYGEFRTAEEFLRRLRERLFGTRPPVAPPEAAPQAPQARQAPPAEPRPAELTMLHGLLRALGPGWAAEPTELDPVRYLGQELRDLVDLERVRPQAVVTELDVLLSGGRTEAELASYLTEAGVRQGVAPAAGTFLRALRSEAHDVASAYVAVADDPERVAAVTLDDLREGEFARAMTGMVRCHGVPAIRAGVPVGFAAESGELLDRVLPPQVAAYLDEATYAAQLGVDAAGLRRVCWMRSAIELILTEHGERDAAAFLDPAQLGALDGVLRDRIRRHPSYPAGVAVDLPSAHWWWAGGPVAGPAIGTGWYAGAGVWQATLTATETDRRSARRLVDRAVQAAATGFGELVEVRDVKVDIEVFDPGGAAIWGGREVTASLTGGRVVPAREIPGAPSGERLVSAVTAYGVLSGGGTPARWAVDLVRDGKTGAPTGSALTTLVLDREPTGSGVARLEDALRGWEDALGAPIGDWRSATRPTSVGRYGWRRETFAYDPPRAHPLLGGVSAHLWDGDLGPALVGLTRAYAADVVADVDHRPWEDDWVAALGYLGADRWDGYLAELVAATRQLTEQRWYELCLARSGVQYVAEQLAGKRLADVVGFERITVLDDAMRTFGHRFGPVSLDEVPGRLHRVHRWWRYPSGTPSGSRAPAPGELAAELAKEVAKPEPQRPTRASTESLTAIASSMDRVLAGELPGCDGATAAEFCNDAAGSWLGTADLTKHVLGFFRPIAHHARLWRTPSSSAAATDPAVAPSD